MSVITSWIVAVPRIVKQAMRYFSWTKTAEARRSGTFVSVVFGANMHTITSNLVALPAVACQLPC
jgi:hypothetical protein